MALLAGHLCAQPRPRVRGAVTELGSNQPVVGATVTVWLRPEPAPKILINGGFKDVYITTQTGNDGSFSFAVERFGVLMVKVAKDGFRGAAMFQDSIDQANFTLDADHPSRELAMHLTRPGAITGRVVDEDTRKPLSGVKLGAYQADYQGGQRRFLGSGSLGVTDAEGRFTLAKLTAADYVVAVRPQTQDDGRLVLKFAPEDFAAMDRDFERTWWPGGRDQELAVPVPVGSGQTFDLGLIAVRQAPLYRVKMTLACAADGEADVGLVVRTGFFTSQSNSSKVLCNQPFLIARLSPGTYTAEARSGRERGSVPFVVADRNLEVTGTLARGVDIDLRFLPNEGARKADWSGVRLLLRPLGRAPYLEDLPGSPDEAGHVRLINVEAREYDLRFAELPAGFYVKEVTYNGAVMPFGTLTVSGAAMAHRIEVAVDDKPATIGGTTQPGARVVLVRWPLRTPDPRASQTTTDAGDDGKYQFANLAPVEYRLFAIPAGTAGRLNYPGVLDALLAGAKKVTPAAGAVETQNLEVQRQ